MKQKEVNRKLLKQWLEEQKELNGPQKETLEQWFLTNEGNQEGLYECYKKVLDCSGEECTQQGICLGKEQWKSLLSGAADLLQDILPLGSVADLKKERMQEQIPGLENVQQIRVVITQRFLSYTQKGYFTYAGVVYPVGNLQGNQVIHFNPIMIENVVHKGYADEQEAAYLYLMKQEYVLQKGMYNYEFASEEEGRELIKKLEGNHVKRN